MKNLLLLVCSVTIIAASCNFRGGKRINGNGKIITETRNTGDFAGVSSSGSFDLYVNSGPFSVKIEAEENLLPYIETYVENGELKIDTKDGYWINTNRDAKIYVTAPTFNRIYSSGSGDIIGQNKITDPKRIVVGVSGSADIKLIVDAPEIQADITGSGEADLQGDTKVFSAQINGSGEIKAQYLKAEETTIDINGSGDAEVYASVKLNVNVAGSGNVKYRGNAQVSSNIAGGGKVKKVD